MVDALPEFIDPLALADKRRQFKGCLPFSKMPRLQDLLLVREGEARFQLRFEREGNIAAVIGVVEAELELQCQCCLESIHWPVSSRVRLGIVRSLDEAGLLPESYEPLLLDGDDPMSLCDIVQDELMLAIPLIPQHEHCKPAETTKKIMAEETPGRPNAFAVLAELKQ